MIRLYVKDTFLSAYEAIDGVYQKRTLQMLAQFMHNILMPAKNLEKLPRYVALYSLRISAKYRTLIRKINSDSYLLLFVGCHDVVYEWCKKNKKSHKNIGVDEEEYRKIEEVFPDIIGYINEPESADAGFVETESESEQMPSSEGRHNSERQMPGTPDSIRDYAANAFPDNYVENGNVGSEKGNGKFTCLSGCPGGGKTTRLLHAIKKNDGFFSKCEDRYRVLFLVCNPDTLNETKSYISLFFGGIPDYLDILTFDELFRRQFESCSTRWKLDFSIENLERGTKLYAMFAACLQQENCSSDDIEWYYDEWHSVVERFGVYTAYDYLNCPRTGRFQADCDTAELFSKVLDIFTKQMQEQKIYTPGFAQKKFHEMCKKKNYRAYHTAYVDDVHFLTKTQLDLVSALARGEKNVFAFDPAYILGNPGFVETVKTFQSETRVFSVSRNKRMTGAKAEWTKKFNEMLFPQFVSESIADSTREKAGKSGAPDSNLVGIGFNGSYANKDEMTHALLGVLENVECPEQWGIVVSNMAEAISLQEELDKYAVPHIFFGAENSTIDRLTEQGVRICTLCSLGNHVFSNVVLFHPQEKAVADTEEVPGYAENCPRPDKITLRGYLFCRAVNASLGKTYYLSASQEDNLIDSVLSRTGERDQEPV